MTSLTSLWCCYCYLLTYFTSFTRVFIVDFEHVFLCWVRITKKYFVMNDPNKTSIGIQVLHGFLQVSFQKSLKHAQPHLIAVLNIYTLTKIYHSEIITGMMRKIWKNNAKTNKTLLATYNKCAMGTLFRNVSKGERLK